MDLHLIKKNTETLLKELPRGVRLVVAAKQRSIEEVLAAIEGGARIIGHNYVKEAEAQRDALREAEFHLIGHLQTNKVKKALGVFDTIQTLDSLKLAEEIQRCCEIKGIYKKVLIEINSARETKKSGVLPEEIFGLLGELEGLDRIYVKGLMTMGPLVQDPEQIRPYFRLTRELFEGLKNRSYKNVEMQVLSMGMSDTFQIAIQEGANMVRVGTRIFGPRN